MGGGGGGVDDKVTVDVGGPASMLASGTVNGKGTVEWQ